MQVWLASEFKPYSHIALIAGKLQPQLFTQIVMCEGGHLVMGAGCYMLIQHNIRQADSGLPAQRSAGPDFAGYFLRSPGFWKCKHTTNIKRGCLLQSQQMNLVDGRHLGIGDNHQ